MSNPNKPIETNWKFSFIQQMNHWRKEVQRFDSTP